jgi:TonB family protein
LFFAGLFPITANSQSAGATDVQLNAEYKGKVFLLRDFYSGKEIDFDEDGKALASTAVGSWTLAKVKIGGIQMLPQSIEIKGERLGSWFTDGTIRLMKAGEITVRIARPNSATDPLSTARQLLTRVFIPAGEDVCSDFPDFWQLYCSRTDPKASERVWDNILTRNNLTPYNSIIKPAGTPKSKITAPVVQSSTDPRYTDAARKHRIEGTTVLKLVVDNAGRPAAVTVVRPVGMGLDEEAGRCVSQWRFRPSTQDGKPVPVQIEVEVNFRCCP